MTAHPRGVDHPGRAETCSWILATNAARFRCVIRDRAGQFTDSFDACSPTWHRHGEDPTRCPRANAFAERGSARCGARSPTACSSYGWNGTCAGAAE